jgi:hypothetical protein
MTEERCGGGITGTLVYQFLLCQAITAHLFAYSLVQVNLNVITLSPALMIRSVRGWFRCDGKVKVCVLQQTSCMWESRNLTEFRQSL